MLDIRTKFLQPFLIAVSNIVNKEEVRLLYTNLHLLVSTESTILSISPSTLMLTRAPKSMSPIQQNDIEHEVVAEKSRQ
jgi:hypothetical protein